MSEGDLELAQVPDDEALLAETPTAPDQGLERAPDEEIEAVQEGVSDRFERYEATKAAMESLGTNHQFNLDTITKQEVVKGEIVLHCSNIYEYLKMAFPEGEDRAIADANGALLERLSTEDPREFAQVVADLEESPDKDWIYDRITFMGSVVDVQGVGRKVVIMNDVAIRREMTKGDDGKARQRTEEEKAAYEKDNQCTVNHEVQHVKYYGERGAHVQQVLETRQAAGDLSPDEEEYIMVEFLTKDEILAHMYNELTPQGDINWKGIKANLKRETYSREILRTENVSRYEKTVDELVDRTQESFVQQDIPENPSTEGFDEAVGKVTADLIEHHPQAFTDFEKI